MFRFSQGPWTKLFDGTIEGQSIEILANNESLVLVIVYEKEKDKIVGMVLELFKAFSCTGETEAFIESLPRESIVFLKHNENRTFKFLMLGSSPTYTEPEEEKALNEFDDLLKNLNNTAKIVMDVSKAYDLSLTQIHEAQEEERQAFFAEPIAMHMLSHATIVPQKRGAAEITGIPGELLLGITKDGNIAKEPLELFNKAIITGASEQYRMHTAHIVIEGALLSSLAVVVIDWKNSFRGLSEPAKDLQGLRKFKVDFEPIGFPVAHFVVPENIKIELGIIDMRGLLELFGAGNNAATKIIVQKNLQKKHKNTQELAETIKKTIPTDEASPYQINKAMRILSLFELHYPNLLDGKNNFNEIAKSWMKGLGRAGVIHMENNDEKTNILIVHSIIRGLLEHFKEQGMTNRLRAMIIIPEAKKILPSIETNSLSRTIASELIELVAYGVGFALSAEKASELSKEIIEKSESEIGIIEKNDVGIKIKSRKNYRALLRPGLSSCTEM